MNLLIGTLLCYLLLTLRKVTNFNETKEIKGRKKGSIVATVILRNQANNLAVDGCKQRMRVLLCVFNVPFNIQNMIILFVIIRVLMQF